MIPSLTVHVILLMIIVPLVFRLVKDLALGGSGTSFRGWALARLRAFVANVDVLRPPSVPQTQSPYRGRLYVLPQRVGTRPSILGGTPQTQVYFPSPPNTQAALEEIMAEFVTSESGHTIEIRQSLERGLLALRRRHRLTIPMMNRGVQQILKLLSIRRIRLAEKYSMLIAMARPMLYYTPSVADG